MWGNFRLQTKNNFCLCFRSLSGIGHIHGRDCWVTCRGGLYEKKEKNYKHLWGQSSLVNMWWEFELSPNKSGDDEEESFDWMTDEKPIFRKIYRPLPLHFPITFSRVNRAKNLNGICISIKTSPNKRKQRGWQLFYVLWHYFSEVPIKCLLI